MIKALTFICLVGIVSASVITVKKKFEIVPYTAGDAEGVGEIPTRSCGGPGKMVAMYSEGCGGDNKSPCKVAHDAAGRQELVFIPSEDISGLMARITITQTPDGPAKNFTVPFTDTKLVKGKEYVFKFVGGAGPDFKDKDFSSQLELLKNDGTDLEICGQLDFHAF